MKSDRRQYWKDYYLAHRQAKNKAQLAFYHANKNDPAHKLALKRRYQKYRSSPKGRATARRYWLANREKILAWHRAWIQKNWGNWKVYKQHLNDKI